MPESSQLSDTQQRALDVMRVQRGKLTSGEGFSIATLRALERDGLVTLKTWRGADRTLSTNNRSKQFSATLTEAGWGDVTPTQEPVYPHGEPTPHAELQVGDQVVNVYTGALGTWQGRSGTGSWSVKDNTTRTPFYHHDETPHWRFVSRPVPAPNEPQEAPQESPKAEEGPRTSARDAQGRLLRIGQRITYKSRDGLLHHGPITAFRTTEEGEPTVSFLADSYQVAPPARVPKGMPRKPGRLRTDEPPQEYTVALDKRVTLAE